MSTTIPRPLFALGRVVATLGGLDALQSADVDARELLQRHVTGDWGDVSPDDARENELSVRESFRVVSSYPVHDDRVWVITEADRSLTTLLLPSEY